jgi:hypothetical protein
MKKLKLKLELWCINTLANCGILKPHQINPICKTILFDFGGDVIFKHFAGPKDQLALAILRRWYKYQAYVKVFNIYPMRKFKK